LYLIFDGALAGVEVRIGLEVGSNVETGLGAALVDLAEVAVEAAAVVAELLVDAGAVLART